MGCLEVVAYDLSLDEKDHVFGNVGAQIGDAFEVTRCRHRVDGRLYDRGAVVIKRKSVATD